MQTDAQTPYFNISASQSERRCVEVLLIPVSVNAPALIRDGRKKAIIKLASPTL